MDYKEAGVDIEEGYRAVEKYRELARSTQGPEVLGGIGGFAGLFALGEGMKDPVLVSGTDGVGTKLEIALRLKKYDTVGIDCVAMCANDILCHGARPLFFLDYLSCGKLDSDVAAALVKGVARGCRETGMALLGGETAEMPGFYRAGKYDMAGFALGIVDRASIIDGSTIEEGDLLLGIASSGPHSNGFSLIRRLLPDLEEDFGGMPIGRAILEPTRLYVKPLLSLLGRFDIRGMAHITGGGFYENIPRLFPADAEGRRGFDARIYPPAFAAGGRSWTVPPIFARIAYGLSGGGLRRDAWDPLQGSQDPRRGSQEAGAALLAADESLREEMFHTFNMGIGFVLALPPGDAESVIEALDALGFPAWEIGRVEKGRGGLYFD